MSFDKNTPSVHCSSHFHFHRFRLINKNSIYPKSSVGHVKIADSISYKLNWFILTKFSDSNSSTSAGKLNVAFNPSSDYTNCEIEKIEINNI